MNSSALSRRRFLSALGGMVAVGALAACATSPAPASPTAAPAVPAGAIPAPAAPAPPTLAPGAPTPAATAATAYPAPAAAPPPTYAPTQAAYPYPAPAQPNPVAATAYPVAQGAPATTAQGQLVFGAPLGTTGANAVEGGLTRNGYNTWVKYVNLAGGVKAGGKQYQVSIKYYDDASNPDQSAQLTERLITQDGIKLLFGPYGSAPTFSATSVAEKYKVVMVEGNGAASNIFSRGYKYIFGTLSPATQYGAVMLDLAIHLTPKPSSVVILSANDSFSVEVGTAAEAFAKQNGLTVTRHDKYPANATDLSAVVTQAKQTGSDILLNSGHLPESLAIMKSAKELDFSPKLFCFTVGPTTPDFLKTLGGDAEGVVASTQWTEVEKWQGTDIFGTPQKFNQLYQQDFNNQVPDYHVADGASVGVVMQVAIEKANSLEPDAVRDALSKLDLMTFYGPIKFDERGVNLAHPMAVQQIQKGKLPTIWPAEMSNASPAYPTPAWSAR